MSLHRVTVRLDGCHPLHEDYPLLPGDILARSDDEGDDQGWAKVAPGLGIFGFVLTEEDEATLEPADDVRWVID